MSVDQPPTEEVVTSNFFASPQQDLEQIEAPVTSDFFGTPKKVFLLNPANYEIAQGKSQRFDYEVMLIVWFIMNILLLCSAAFMTLPILNPNLHNGKEYVITIGIVWTFTIPLAIHGLIYVPLQHPLRIRGEIIDGEVVSAEFVVIPNRGQSYDLNLMYKFIHPKTRKVTYDEQIVRRFDLESKDLPKRTTPVKILYFATMEPLYRVL